MTPRAAVAHTATFPLGVDEVAVCTVFSPVPEHGNPTAVFHLPAWPAVERLQDLALASGVDEATFVVLDGTDVEVRWFAGHHEVPLCGHGALAAAAMLAPLLRPAELHPVRNLPDRLWLAHEDGRPQIAFRPAVLAEVPANAFAFGMPVRRVFDAGRDFLVVVEDDRALRAIEPDDAVLSRLPKIGCIVTAPCADATAAFRYFAPRAGIHEDRASGSVVPALAALWGRGRRDLEFHQRSGWDIRIRASQEDGHVVVTGEVLEWSRRYVSRLTQGDARR